VQGGQAGDSGGHSASPQWWFLGVAVLCGGGLSVALGNCGRVWMDDVYVKLEVVAIA
jgi:hypothetical protein